MKIAKSLMAAAAIASITSAPAFAGTPTRSASALPTTNDGQVRDATKLKKKANNILPFLSTIPTGAIIVGTTVILGGIAIGTIAATDENKVSGSGQQ